MKLKRLQLDNNQFTGDITAAISQLSAIELLYLNKNQLTGTIPHEIGLLTTLKFLKLSNNNISGCVPDSVSNLTKLQLCVMSNNRIHGPAPRNLTTLTSLVDFHIFTSYPSLSLSTPRSFQPDTFQRMYGWGPSIGIDSLHWPMDEESS